MTETAMSSNLLFLSALGVAFLHTVLGPDHYLPFVFLARARKWTMKKLWVVVLACGVGHVLSSVLLGFLGVAVGVAVSSLVAIESTRGEVAVYLLIAFGLIYAAWGIHHGIRNRPHTHGHVHDGEYHVHEHSHLGDHAHPHDERKVVTPWILFIIFVFGPCEPLIPLFIYPAAQHNWGLVIAVALGFSAVTVGMMLLLATVLYKGISLVPARGLERWTHAMAGILIAVTGTTLRIFGL